MNEYGDQRRKSRKVTGSDDILEEPLAISDRFNGNAILKGWKGTFETETSHSVWVESDKTIFRHCR